MKKKIQVIIAGIIIVAGSFLYAHIGKNNYIYDRAVDTSEYITTGSFLNETVQERFKSNEDTLDGVRVKCRITGTPSDTVIKYSLTDAETQKVVANGETKATDLESGKFYNFKFDTVKNCKDKEYIFSIGTEGEIPDNAVLFCFERKTEQGTKFWINDEETDGTLIMKAVTNRFDAETFCVLLLFIVYVIAFMKFLYKLFK